MIFDLDGLQVFFPYDRIYNEQYLYMRSLKQALDAGGHALLEMPTGTGKTVCLLSLITSYQYANPTAGKLVYCTRTVPEMNHVMEELGTVLAYRADMLLQQEQENTNVSMDVEESHAVASAPEVESSASSSPAKKKARRVYNRRGKNNHKMGPINDGRGAGGSGLLALCLSSRRNMCIHERVMAESDREAVDAACRNMTASWVMEANEKRPGSVETCSYYDNFRAAGESTTMPSGVYDLEELQKWGKLRGWCPYYLTRQGKQEFSIEHFHFWPG